MTEPSPKRLQLAQDFMAAIGRSDVEGAISLLSLDRDLSRRRAFTRFPGLSPLTRSWIIC